MDLEAYQTNWTGCRIWSLNLVECQQTAVSNLFINKDYHMNGSFEDGLKEKLLARYTVVFFPFCSFITRTRLVTVVIVPIVPIFTEGYSRAKLFIDYLS